MNFESNKMDLAINNILYQLHSSNFGIIFFIWKLSTINVNELLDISACAATNFAMFIEKPLPSYLPFLPLLK